MKLEIEKLIYGGQGLARIPEAEGVRSGMRAFVPFTLPGEVVEAKITSEQRGYCEAAVQSVQQSSPSRIPPPCPWFGACGGCQMQHAAYALQLEIKRGILAESLTRAGLRDLPEIASLAGAPFGYRNRVRLQVHTGAEFAVGYRQAKSHRMIAIDHCPVALPLLQQCIGTFHSLARDKALPHGLEEVEMFTNHDQSELLITLWTGSQKRRNLDPFHAFFSKLREALPALTGGAVLPPDSIHAATPLVQWGHPELRYRVAGRDYTVSIGSFFQVNATLLDSFVPAVVGEQRGAVAWDLYAGAGLFSLALSERFKHIVSVESAHAAVRDLRVNLRGASPTIQRSTTLEFLQKAVRNTIQADAPDLVLLDPPRAGAGVEACRLLAKCSPMQIVYVSCDPATLGRDLTALIQSGYRLDRLQLVDMFPQTGHVETIATLKR